MLYYLLVFFNGYTYFHLFMVKITTTMGIDARCNYWCSNYHVVEWKLLFIIFRSVGVLVDSLGDKLRL